MFERIIRRALLLVGALVLIGTANPSWAQRVTPCSSATPNSAVCIVITAPTKREDGSDITGTLTYRAEQKVGTGSYTSSTVTQGAGWLYVQNLSPGSYTFRVYATENGVTSGPSNEAGKGVTQAQPNAPTIIIAATIRADGPPSYRIIQQVNLKPNEVVFAAPAEMRPLFASR